MERNETVQEFSDRFGDLQRFCGFQDDDEHLVEIFKNALPKNIEVQVEMLENATLRSNPEFVSTISSLSTDAIAFEAVLKKDEKDERDKKPKEKKDTRTCHYCKLEGHIEKDCKGKQYDQKHNVLINKDKGLKKNSNDSNRQRASNDSRNSSGSYSLNQMSSRTGQTPPQSSPQSRPSASGTPPPGYLCRRCDQPGHFIKNCPAPARQLNHVRFAEPSEGSATSRHFGRRPR